MTAKAKYRSRISGVIHEAAKGTFDAGVMDKATMRHFDESCLIEVINHTPADILAIREQAVGGKPRKRFITHP